MKDYKRLGDYIREVNVRNRELRVTNLMGISMTKKFRPSTSNVVGTDLSNYKIVSKNIFVFDTMSVIRVHKVPIAINNTDEPIIVSPAYHTFEVIDKNTLMPEYLMMWFCRPEFDRYADFKSDSAIRGGYGWDELCDTIIDVPTLARQREIVSEYETLANRIRLNEQMVAKLEKTAQALYRKMFMDGVDKENLPAGWRWGKLEEYVELSQGIQVEVEDAKDFCSAEKLWEKLGTKAENDKYYIQQQALCRYKSEVPTKLRALTDALSIIEKIGNQSDTETYGIKGAIYKRLWEETKDNSYLDSAIESYKKGWSLHEDYYTGENYANCMYMRAMVLDGELKIHSKMEAKLTFEKIIRIVLKSLEEDEPEEVMWKYATLSNSYLALKQYDDAKKYENMFREQNPSQWQIETFEKTKQLYSE